MAVLNVFFFFCTGWFSVAHQFNRAFRAVLSIILHFYQEDPDPVSSSLIILGLAYPTLLSFLSLKYTPQNQVDPFQSHPKTARVSVISFLLYCMLISIHNSFSSHNNYRNYAIAFRRARMLFSGLSLTLTTSLFFADIIRPILCVVCVLFCFADWVLQKIVARIVERSEARGNFCWLFSCPTSVRSDRPSLPV